MANTIVQRRRIRKRQPLQFLPVDWQNKYTRGIIAFLARPALDPINAVNGKAFTLGSGFAALNTIVPGITWQALRITGVSQGQNANLTLPTSGLSTRSFSFLARLRTTASNVAGVGARDNGSNILLWRNSGAWDMRVGGTDYTQAGTYSLDKWYNYAITSGPASAKLYVDDSLLINGGVAGTGTLADLLVGSDPQGGGAHDVEIEWAVVANREFAAHEVRAIFAAPYQLLGSTFRRTVFDLGSSGGTTITAIVGIADASGFRANVDLQRTLAASLASAAAKGFSANIDLRRNINAVKASAAAFGHLAGVDLKRSIIAALGAAVAKGYDASISLAGALNIPASMGEASATGKQANVNLTLEIDASTGIASATGFSATIGTESPPFTQEQLDYLLAYMQEKLMIPTAADIAAAVLAALNATTIPVNVTHFNGNATQGSGAPGDPVRPL